MGVKQSDFDHLPEAASDADEGGEDEGSVAVEVVEDGEIEDNFVSSAGGCGVAQGVVVTMAGSSGRRSTRRVGCRLRRSLQRCRSTANSSLTAATWMSSQHGLKM